jgi:hypothetical protein
MATVDVTDLRRAGGAMLVAAAAWPLLPDGTGIPCPLRAITGVPCPLCGMTTSVTATAYGHLSTAVAANPAGVVAVVVALALVVWRGNSVRLPVALIPAALAAMWVFELFRFRVL